MIAVNNKGSQIGRALLKGSERVPIISWLSALAYRRYFNTATGEVRLFKGIYPNFPAASRAIPPNRLQGYDNPPSASRLVHERFRIIPADYPIIFWLLKLLPECELLFDWGGNVGISYFAYRRYLNYPSRLIWHVSDVPAVTAMGQTIASQEDSPGLRFSSSLEALAVADILLAAGTLHFIEDPFAILGSIPKLPRHVLLNKVPTYDLPSAVTLQNMGSAFCPNHLFNRAAFLRNFEQLGYRLIDEWLSPDLACYIPFHRDHSIRAYSGFYLSRAD
jgi:putative methyltransferase (TIGR04325 family)